MSDLEKLLTQLKTNPRNCRFQDLCKICDYYFGKPRQNKGSHRIYKTPWPGDPRINIQNHQGKAKVYQVKQVLSAIEKLESEHDFKKN
jgi:hypothetical protein